jgi:sensor domain CHASE-containing protein/putative methionine-R-sulfoxide reductase with GAF domain
MNLRIRTFILIGVIALGLAAVYYGVTSAFVGQIYTELEQQSLRANTERLASLINTNIAGISRVARAYARSEATYLFLQERQPESLVNSLNAATFANDSLDVVVIFDSSGRVAYEASYNPQTESIIPRAQSLVTYARNLETQEQRTFLTRPTDPNSDISGLIALPEGPMIMAAQPIMVPDSIGVISGTLMLGRYLDTVEEQRIVDQIRLPVSFIGLNPASMPEDMAQINRALSPENPVHITLQEDSMSGYIPLNDIIGRRILLARVDAQRGGWTQNVEVQRFLVGLAFLAGLLLAVALGGVSYAAGFVPMNSLRRVLKTIQDKNAWDGRAAGSGKDEYGRLVEEVNSLLARHEQATQDVAQGKAAQHFLVRAQAVREISQKITGILRSEEIVRKLVAELGDRFGYYYVGIFLLDDLKINAVLQAGTGNVVPEGYQLTVGGSSSVGMCIVRKEIQVAEIGSRKEQLSFTRLPMARSEAAAPICFGEEVLGAIAVQSTQAETFKQPQEREILQYLADYAGAVLTTSRMLETAQQNNRALEQRFQQYLVDRWNEELRLQNVLQATFQKKDERKRAPKTAQVHLPMVLDGVDIGTVTIDLPEQHVVAQGLRADLQELADAVLAQSVQALENARVLERSQRKAAQERLVTEVVGAVRASTNVDTILNTTALELGRLLRAASVELRIQPRASAILLEQINQPGDEFAAGLADAERTARTPAVIAPAVADDTTDDEGVA